MSFEKWREEEQLTEERNALKRDIMAYRGALGYAVPSGCPELLHDGTLPINGLAKALLQERDALKVELQAWREGGLTEENLRKGDSYIKVGRGCLLISERYLEEIKAKPTEQIKQERDEQHKILNLLANQRDQVIAKLNVVEEELALLKLWVAEQMKLTITGIDPAGKSVSGRWEYKPERQHSPEWAAFWNMVDKGKE